MGPVTMVTAAQGSRKAPLTAAELARISDLEQQVTMVHAWSEAVQAELRALRDAPATSTVDEDVAEADSPTRVQKALEREFQVDRRTIYGWVERLVKVYQLERKYGPQWATNLKLWRDMAKRDDNGVTALERGMASLKTKQEGQAQA